MARSRSILVAGAAALASLASAIPYEQYILAPSSRQLYPESVYNVNGTVESAESLATGSSALGSAVFDGVSAVTFDFEKNIAGLVTLEIGEVSSADQYIGITFTESSLWISGNGSDATADFGVDEVLWFQPTEAGSYTVSREHERGAFRYLSLVHNTTGSMEVKQVEVYFTAMPDAADDALRNYTGWFNCDDELINRIWYAGVWTDQLCTIDPKHGDSLVLQAENSSSYDVNGTVPWHNNITISNGTSVLVDGAKRDRLVWPGDLTLSLPAVAVSFGDLISSRNGLDSLYLIQNMTTGMLPYAGSPFIEIAKQIYGPLIGSYTYHMHSLTSSWYYYLYSGDVEWVLGKWDQYKLGLEFSLSAVDESGLANVTYSADWARAGMSGHNIEANAILYFVLQNSITLATLLNDTAMVDNWTTTAAGIKSAANALLWSNELGMYIDNETTTLTPQDGNSWAVLGNLTDSPEKARLVSENLRARWTPYGAPAPEAYGTTISPFIGGFELQAHLTASSLSAASASSNSSSLATTALDFMRLQWGDFMLDDPRMTNSSFIEGYSSDGSLHYPWYNTDQRVSHAHGWSTGPTMVLTTMVAGIKLLTPLGQTWSVQPRLGDLNRVDAGFSTELGVFSVAIETGKGFELELKTPMGSSGTVVIGAELQMLCPASKGRVSVEGKDGSKPCGDVTTNGDGEDVELVLDGGEYKVEYTC